MLIRLSRLVTAAPKRILAAAMIILIGSGIWGAGVMSSLGSGGFADPESQSSVAQREMERTFGRGGMEIIFQLSAPDGADPATSPKTVAAAKKITDTLNKYEFVQQPVVSLWNGGPAAESLRSKDSRSGLIVANLDGDDTQAPAHAKQIAAEIGESVDGVPVKIGGGAMVYQQVNSQISKDLAIAEGIAIPISFLVLIWVFGGMVAAALPIITGVFSIVVTLAILRLISSVTDVSIFALNLTTALGLALAIDYSLLVVSRYREELAAGYDGSVALARTLSSAGRTVIFSGVTVALSLSVLALFPMYFLRSFAYAGLAVVLLAVSAALLIVPAILMVLGPRIDAGDVRKPLRRLFGRPAPTIVEPHDSLLYKLSHGVFRHAVVVGIAVVTLLLILGAPFLGIKFGYPDDRVLPASASAHQVGDAVRGDFNQNATADVSILMRDRAGVDDARIGQYAEQLSRVQDVQSVVAPQGTFVDGKAVAPGNPSAAKGDSLYIRVSSAIDPMSDDGARQLDALHAVSSPAATLFDGVAQQNRDAVNAILDRLPLVLGLIALTTIVLLFLLTGSVILPLKAVVLNILSLSATFGAMVFIFQEGNFGGLGTTVTGVVIANIPVLMFCVAFGLSMDYEVFLLSRIREEWLKSGGTLADNREAVAVGVARSGRIITAAALLMVVVFGAITSSEVSFMRMLGLGLALAVIVDATLVRLLLVPAFMRIAGRANWWAPAPLRKLHDKFGLSEAGEMPEGVHR